MTSPEENCDRPRIELCRSSAEQAVSFQKMFYFASFQEYCFSIFSTFFWGSLELCSNSTFSTYAFPKLKVLLHDQSLDLYQCKTHVLCCCNMFMFTCMHFCLQQIQDHATCPKSLSLQLENSYLMTGEEPNSFHLMEDWVVGVINGITAVDISHCQKGV